MPANQEKLLHQFRLLLSAVPDLYEETPSLDTYQWLGRASALVEQSGDMAGAIMLNTAAQNLGGYTSFTNVQTIMAVLTRCLARAELNAPVSQQGAFIPAGGAFDAFSAVGKVFEQAKDEILIVDPYADEKLLTDYAVLGSDGVRFKILTDRATHKSSLKPATERWQAQHGATRPLEVRLTTPRLLHDRLIVLDRSSAWVVGQSFNHIAERAPTSIVRMDPESAGLKVAAHEALWDQASPI